jgi:hypothetical protein
LALNSAVCTLRFLPSLMRYHPFKDDSLNHRLKFGVHYTNPSLIFIEAKKVFDPLEVYGDVPNPTQL